MEIYEKIVPMFISVRIRNRDIVTHILFVVIMKPTRRWVLTLRGWEALSDGEC